MKNIIRIMISLAVAAALTSCKDLLDKQPQLSRLGLWALRLLFTTENAGQVNAVLRAWETGAAMEPGVTTRGLYLRGVE